MDFHFQHFHLLVDRKKLNRIELSSECNRKENCSCWHNTCASLLIFLYCFVGVHKKFCLSGNSPQSFTTTKYLINHMCLTTPIAIEHHKHWVHLFVISLLFFLDYKIKRSCLSGAITLNLIRLGGRVGEGGQTTPASIFCFITF